MANYNIFKAIFFIGVCTLVAMTAKPQSNTNGMAIKDPAVKRTIEKLDSLVDQKNKFHQFSGIVLISKLYTTGSETGTVFMKFCGTPDLETKQPFTPDTKFITASTAKSFTAVAIMQLSESGKIRLDDPLSAYLPGEEFPDSVTSHLSIRQLLTHTAGLGDIITGKAFRSAPGDFEHLRQLVELVRKEPRIDTPGVFHYGGSDYILLGAVIERASGQLFADYMHDHVFVPAGMLHTGFDMNVRPDGLAHGYSARDINGKLYSIPAKGLNGDTVLRLRPNDAILPKTGVPGSVAYTSAPDLARFARALAGNKLLAANTRRDLWTGKVQTRQEGPNKMYAYGFFAGTDGNNSIVNHGGTGPGIDNCFDIYPGLGYVVVILSNLDPPSGQDIREFIREGFSHAGQ